MRVCHFCCFFLTFHTYTQIYLCAAYVYWGIAIIIKNFVITSLHHWTYARLDNKEHCSLSIFLHPDSVTFHMYVCLQKLYRRVCMLCMIYENFIPYNNRDIDRFCIYFLIVRNGKRSRLFLFYDGCKWLLVAAVLYDYECEWSELACIIATLGFLFFSLSTYITEKLTFLRSFASKQCMTASVGFCEWNRKVQRWLLRLLLTVAWLWFKCYHGKRGPALVFAGLKCIQETFSAGNELWRITQIKIMASYVEILTQNIEKFEHFFSCINAWMLN